MVMEQAGWLEILTRPKMEKNGGKRSKLTMKGKMCLSNKWRGKVSWSAKKRRREVK